MTRKVFEQKNKKTASHAKKEDLNFLKLLELIGSPFFKILSLSVITLLFISRFFGTLITNLPNLLKFISIPHQKRGGKKNIIQNLKKSFFKLKKEKAIWGIFETIQKYIKIFLLKIKLLFLRFFSSKNIKISRKVFGFSTLFASLCVLMWVFVFKNLPSPKMLVTRNQNVSTRIYSEDGVLLYQIYKDENRTLVSLKDVPDNLRLATLAAEDAEFYNHPGFSIRGITRAIFENATEGKLVGGSTITQQLVKNALLTPEKTISRKIKELILSIEVEMQYSKDEILEMYLNEVGYGGTSYGIVEASRNYFGKELKDLSIAECAFLAGLPKSPTTFSPYGSTPELGLSRQKDVLRLMKINGYITDEQYIDAVNENLEFAKNETDIKAPHFVMYVREELENLLGKEMVEKGGLEVVTTLDYKIQKMAEDVVKSEVEKLRGLNVSNGAAIVLNSKTGEILAMVGSKDYFNTKEDGNVNITTRLRQPGSSIKIVNYAYALSNELNAATVIPDTPVTFSVPGQPPYSPKNYDGTFKGNLSLREAFAQSRNVPAVKVLANYGAQKMFEFGNKMGLTNWQNDSNYGLSLTLGGKEVRLVDLANVYATVANHGQKNDLKSIKSISNYKKLNLLSKQKDPKKIIDEGVAFILTDILKDNNARTPAFGANSLLNIKGHPEVAVKTGTSNNLRDNLAIGYNQDYVVAVWVGNNDNSPMSRVASGITGATPIWNKIMTNLLSDKESVDWTAPDDVIKVDICQKTGTLPCTGCPIKAEWFVKGTEPKKACSFNPENLDNSKILDEGASTSRD